MTRPIRRFAVLGDLHVGSRVAPWPPYETREQGWVYPNPAQEYLLDCFHEYWRWVEDTGGCDTVLLGGDICDGGNPKDHGRSLSSPELLEQLENAEALLKPYCEGKTVLSLEGSGYHTGKDISLDELLAERLNASYHGLILAARVADTRHIMLAYHKGRTGGIYRASALESECRALDVAIGRGDITHPVDLIVRFHAHYNLLIRYKHRQILQSACWKLWWPGPISTVGYGDRIPAIGGHVIEFFEDRIEVKDKIFPYYREYDQRRVV